jgi:hypothetical protein
MDKSLDCDHHGRQIEELEQQVAHLDRHSRVTDQARVELLGFIQVVDEFVNEYRAGRTDPDLTVSGLLDLLAKWSKKAHSAHMRKWRQ